MRIVVNVLAIDCAGIINLRGLLVHVDLPCLLIHVLLIVDSCGVSVLVIWLGALTHEVILHRLVRAMYRSAIFS